MAPRPGTEEALAKLLDTAYQEIAAVEAKYGLSVGGSDLRQNIDYYQDSVRAWQEDHANKLAPERIASDLENLRAESAHARSGAMALMGENLTAERLADLREFKRRLLLKPESVTAEPETVYRDIAQFVHWSQEMEHGDLESVLERRGAEKLKRGLTGKKWRFYTAREFHKEFDAAMSWAHQASEEMRLLEGPQEQKDLKRPRSRELADRKLLMLWLVTTHAANLKRSLSQEGEERLRLNTEQHITEAGWQQLGQEARRLGDMYERYALLYAAALSETIDRNVRDQMEELDTAVEELALLKDLIEQLGLDEIDVEQAEELIRQAVEDRERAEMIIAMLLRQLAERNRRVKSEEMIKQAEAHMAAVDQKIDNLEKAHLTFLTNQLGVYEDAKELVKRLAGQGLNLAGQFVEASAAREKTMRGGRGR